MTDEKDRQQAEPLIQIHKELMTYADRAVYGRYEVGAYERSLFDKIVELVKSIDTWL